MQFLYADGTDAHFMDSETYEQIAVPEARSRSRSSGCRPSEEVEVLYVDDSPPTSRCRARSRWPSPRPSPGLRGDTASGGGDKPATLESGVIVRVPLFVNVGDRVRVDTRSGEYVSRA